MLTPRAFCEQALQVLRLTPRAGEGEERAALETLLAYFAGEDIDAAAFELQLWLLAEAATCSHLGAIAERVLMVWRQERAASGAHALAAQTN